MTKGTRRTITKGAPSSSRGKSRRKQRATNRPAAILTSKQQEVPSKVVSPTPIVSRPAAPSAQQIAPQPHVLSDLKRIGVITGVMLLILIILYLVL